MDDSLLDAVPGLPLAPSTVQGLRAAVSLVGVALLLDVLLIRRGHLPISTAIRRSRIARIVTAALCGHLLFRLPHDPLTALGGWVERRGKE